MDNSIEINGIVLSHNAQNVLRRWQNSRSETNCSDPEHYISYLNDTQDYLIKIMLIDGSKKQDDVTELLTKLICIKEDLKLLTLKIEEQS